MGLQEPTWLEEGGGSVYTLLEVVNKGAYGDVLLKWVSFSGLGGIQKTLLNANIDIKLVILFQHFLNLFSK